MIRIHCSCCGGRLDLSPDQKEAVCRNCGQRIVIPKLYSQLESALEFAQAARLRGDYSAAESAYTDLIRQHPDCAAAYWGRALSRYGVSYQNIGTGYRLVCNRVTGDDFAQDPDTGKALDLGTEEESALYLDQMGEISSLQQKVAAYAAGHRADEVLIIASPDAPASLALADKLTAIARTSGRSVFCPALSLRNLPRQDWEPTLYTAFSEAKFMIVAAADPKAFTEDVLFDVRRFLQYKAQAQREAKAEIPQLYVAFDALNEYADIPDVLMDYCDDRFYVGEADFSQTLVNCLKPDKKQGVSVADSAEHSFDYGNLLRQARLSLEAGSFTEAKKGYEQVLNYNFRESQAYWGMLLADFECRSEEDLVKKGCLAEENSNLKNALAFANERQKQIIQITVQDAKDNHARIQERNRQAELQRKKEAEEQASARSHTESAAKQAACKQNSKIERAGRFRAMLGTVIISALVLVVALGGFFGYRQYKNNKDYEYAQSLRRNGNLLEAAEAFDSMGSYKDSNEMAELCRKTYLETTYEKAMQLRNSGEFVQASEIFKSLGDYQDSQKLVGICLEEDLAFRYSNGIAALENGKYPEALDIFSNLEEYEDAPLQWARTFDQYVRNAPDSIGYFSDYDATCETIQKLKDLEQTNPEITDILQNIKDMGLACYEENNLIDAMLYLRAFPWDDPDLHRVAGAYACGGFMAEDRYGNLLYRNINTGAPVYKPAFGSDRNMRLDGIPSVRGVALNAEGDSAALVHEDGTVELAGKITEECDVSDWTDIVSVQIGSYDVIGLTAEGDLYSYLYGYIGSGFRSIVFSEGPYYRDMPGSKYLSIIAGVRKDGTVYVNKDYLQEVVNGWEDVISLTASGIHEGYGGALLGVTADGTLLGTASGEVDEGVTGLYHGSFTTGWIYQGGHVKCTNGMDGYTDKPIALAMASDDTHYKKRHQGYVMDASGELRDIA